MYLTLDSKSKADLLDANTTVSQETVAQQTNSQTNLGIKDPAQMVSLVDNSTPLWGTMLTLQENLNLRIGTQSWKKYINAAFWNYISTPINFTITLFTAMSAGQTGTQSNYLSKDQLFYILFISFILSIINTFFKLKDKAIMNYDSLKKYQDFGADFEKIYFTNVQNNTLLLKKYYCYLDLQSKLNTYESTGSIEQVNYITELIFLAFKSCFSNRMRRINASERFWVLDGKPKEGYYNDYYANIDRQFGHNFDVSNSVLFRDKESNQIMDQTDDEKREKQDVKEGKIKRRLAIDLSDPPPQNTVIKFDIENPPPRESVSRQNISHSSEDSVPDDEDLTDENKSQDIYPERKNTYYSYRKSSRMESLIRILEAHFIHKKTVERDMIMTIMRYAKSWKQSIQKEDLVKCLRALGYAYVLANKHADYIVMRLTKEYENEEKQKQKKKEKDFMNTTHGKKGIPPVNVRLLREKEFQFT
jgi:hypothetical protein